MKKFLGIGLCFLLTLCMTNNSFANTKVYEEDIDLENYVESILQGKIRVVNEDPNFNISTNNVEALEQNEFSRALVNEEQDSFTLEKQDIIKDVRKINSDENIETYRAIVIVDNTYNVKAKSSLSDYSEDILSDVKVFGEIIYDKIKVESGEYGYKITKVRGGYLSTNDPQMTCSKLKLYNKYFGRLYNAYGVFEKSDGFQVSSSFDYPTKGSVKNIVTGQVYYVDTQNGGYNVFFARTFCNEMQCKSVTPQMIFTC
ncbi:MAG: hypothetical protein E7222_14435 [Clostridiales bacterium]|nr:hypothetical protein [Clostridiales bacterium]